MELKIFYAEAFTDKVFCGNTAAIVINEKHLTDEEMQKIAAELKLSETAFVMEMPDKANTFEVRFFTPLQEVDLCGHATIAAFTVLFNNGYIKGKSSCLKCKQITKAGILDVDIYQKDGEIQRIMMLQGEGKIIKTLNETEELCNILGIDKEEFGIYSHKLKPQIITTGLKDIIFPVVNLQALKKLTPNMGRLKSYCKIMDVIGVHVFTLETLNKEATAHCRNFAPLVGINEEAATGTSSGGLAYYLIENSIILSDKFIFEQGHFMNRPSIIHAYINKSNSRIYVGGVAREFITGVLSI
ncbi:PhzF family phenazine biosynthesis protein [Alkaliphilus pronyensis]|nr:PhzF family phenazine biosynthesis protein [Alkaliphilus pronyensis]